LVASDDRRDPVLTCATQHEWESWLERHAGASSGVWLRLAKRGAAEATVSYAQAVESALCHGWIDGQKQAESEHHWLQRFTPRTARSIWSKINKAKAEALIASGRMRPGGLAEVERARQDGRWDAAYAPASTATVPADLQRALDASPKAKAFFATLDGQNRYAVLFRIHNAKKPETRARKIVQFVQMLAEGKTLHPTSRVNPERRRVEKERPPSS
jgi:uncharacterized protein YdeI (YjbR/CyaY-like superfamily)